MDASSDLVAPPVLLPLSFRFPKRNGQGGRLTREVIGSQKKCRVGSLAASDQPTFNSVLPDGEIFPKLDNTCPVSKITVRLPRQTGGQSSRGPVMRYWPPSSWHWRAIWWYAEWVMLAVAAGLGGVAALAESKDKATAVAWSVTFTVGAGLSKLFTRLAEEREKAAKAREAEQAELIRDTELADLRARFGGQAQRMVRAILSHMHDHFFEQEAGQDKHKHRVTLFVCREGAGPRGCRKWLAIYARFGENPESTTTWPLDDNSPEGCRGVAGKIWVENSDQFYVAECDWPENGDPVDKARYAKSLGITVAEAETLHIKSRYFSGALVMVRGAKWGVLLVDSRKDWRKKGGQQTIQTKRTRRYATLLGTVLAEVEL